MTIKSGEAGIANDVIRNVATFLQSAVQTTLNSFKNSVTDVDYNFATVDYFTDTTGYNDTVDLGNTNATHNSVDYYYKGGAVGVGIIFDGNGYGSQAHNSAFESSNFSISCWFKPVGTNSYQVIMIKNNVLAGEWQVSYSGVTNKITFAIRDGSINPSYIESTETLTPSTWYFLTATYDGTNLKIYINAGTPTTTTGARGTGTSAIGLGGSPTGTIKLTGGIDELRYHNVTLSAGQITTLYNSASGTETLLSNEVARWKFNNNTNDDVGAYNWTLYGTGTTYGDAILPSVAGNPRAIDFDGNGWVTVPHHADFESSSFSISCWIKVDGTTFYDRIIKKNRQVAGEWVFAFDNTNKINFQIRDSGGTPHILSSTGTLTAGIWYFVVATYDNNTAKIYINAGTPDSTVLGARPTNTLPIGIGDDDTGSIYKLKGAIDELRYHNAVLTPAQTTTLYNGGAGTETLLSNENARWKFNDDLIDDVNAHNGTLQGTGTTYVAGKLPEPVGALYVQTVSKTFANNIGSVIVAGKIEYDGGSATVDVSTDGGTIWDTTGNSFNSCIICDGDDTDLVLKFNLTGAGCKLYGYGAQVYAPT